MLSSHDVRKGELQYSNHQLTHQHSHSHLLIYTILYELIYRFFFFLLRSEPIIFKARFIDWEDVLDVDFTQTPEKMEKKAIEQVQYVYSVYVTLSDLQYVYNYTVLSHVQ